MIMVPTRAALNEPLKSGPVHFLLVDDLEENLLSLDALLRREGLVLLKAKSGPEALELLLRHEIGLALLDVQMPGMDGFELAELMRSTERTRRIPIIFLTAGTSDRQRRFRGYEAGAVDFLQKPIEPDILKSKAEVFFELDRQRRLLETQRDEIKMKAQENARLLEESRRYAAVLKDTDRRKDEFLATLAHELRNPLAPIRNGLQVLKMSPKAEVVEDLRDMLDRQLNHLVRLIDDLLDVSRINEGKINLTKEIITIDAVLAAALESSGPLIQSRSHQLTTEVPKAPMWVQGDLTRLSQVMSNLLNNAAKYTEEGGQIVLSARQEGDNAVLSVSDNGPGIPPDMQKSVFELFTQVNANLERSQGGLGIGLALAKQLVEMHGGKIDVTSSGLGSGSMFSVWVPLTEAPEDLAPVSADDGKVSDSHTLHVLVVDDNEPSAKTMGWMLELAGHTAELAHSGKDALAAARRKVPDVILLDIGMPEMNGYDVCRALREDQMFKDVVLIAQTGWGQERDRQLAAQAGFDHHLTKPVKFEEFENLIRGIQEKKFGELPRD